MGTIDTFTRFNALENGVEELDKLDELMDVMGVLVVVVEVLVKVVGAEVPSTPNRTGGRHIGSDTITG